MPAQAMVTASPSNDNKSKKAKSSTTVLLFCWIFGTIKDCMMMVGEALKEGETMKPDDRGPPVGKPRASEKYLFKPDPKTTLCGCLE